MWGKVQNRVQSNALDKREELGAKLDARQRCLRKAMQKTRHKAKVPIKVQSKAQNQGTELGADLDAKQRHQTRSKARCSAISAEQGAKLDA